MMTARITCLVLVLAAAAGLNLLGSPAGHAQTSPLPLQISPEKPWPKPGRRQTPARQRESAEGLPGPHMGYRCITSQGVVCNLVSPLIENSLCSCKTPTGTINGFAGNYSPPTLTCEIVPGKICQLSAPLSSGSPCSCPPSVSSWQGNAISPSVTTCVTLHNLRCDIDRQSEGSACSCSIGKGQESDPGVARRPDVNLPIVNVCITEHLTCPLQLPLSEGELCGCTTQNSISVEYGAVKPSEWKSETKVCSTGEGHCPWPVQSEDYTPCRCKVPDGERSAMGTVQPLRSYCITPHHDCQLPAELTGGSPCECPDGGTGHILPMGVSPLLESDPP